MILDNVKRASVKTLYLKRFLKICVRESYFGKQKNILETLGVYYFVRTTPGTDFLFRMSATLKLKPATTRQVPVGL